MLAYLSALLASRVREDRGATAVEYGLMVALIAVAIIATVMLLGTELNDLFVGVEEDVSTANNAS